MRASANWCRISKIDGRSGFKWPRLDELYFKLFQEYIINSHNAIYDTLATKKCFFELVRLDIIQNPLKNISNNEKKTKEKVKNIMKKPTKNRVKFISTQNVSILCSSCGDLFHVTLCRYEESAICPSCFKLVNADVQW
jgi:uncharacterized CHY-type Zn-finger protein